MIHLIAHRGNARDFPENTLPAFQSAIDLGLRFFEFDVQLSADGVPVVIHDQELLRTAGLPGSVFDHSAAELAAIAVYRPEVNDSAEPAGRRRDVIGGAARAGEARIPLLSDVVALLAERREVTAFVEIKRASLRRYGHELVVPRILETLRPVRERSVVISFDLAALHMARHSGGFAIGWVLSDYDDHARLKFEALQPEFLFCDHEKLPAGDAKLWRGPWRWAFYEVEAPERARALMERGADFIETMAVAPMVAALRGLVAGRVAEIGGSPSRESGDAKRT
jgi:glycerophosphoryl diester phosphodiesterase